MAVHGCAAPAATVSGTAVTSVCVPARRTDAVYLAPISALSAGARQEMSAEPTPPTAVASVGASGVPTITLVVATDGGELVAPYTLVAVTSRV